MVVSDEQLDVLRRAPHKLHSLNNVGAGTGYHIWTLYRCGYLEQTDREPSDVTYWVMTYDLTDLGRWTIDANKDRPEYAPTVEKIASEYPNLTRLKRGLLGRALALLKAL